MANEITLVSKFLAHNVLSLRKNRRMSQGELAKLAGVPRSTITYLESGAGNPSLHNLMKVAGALQVSIEELLNRPRANCKLIKQPDIPKQQRAQGKAVIYKILPDSIPGMELDRMEISPNTKMGGVPHTQNTKEYLVCIRGKLEVNVAGQRFSLGPGDVIAFPGDQPHAYCNVGGGTVDCLSVVVLAPPGT